MKTKLIQFWYWILHILWIKRDTIYSFFVDYVKAGRFDWKITFEDFKFIVDKLSKSWLIHDENENIYAWNIIANPNENRSKNLLFDEQRGWDCVAYASMRCINYNTSVVIDNDRKLQYVDEMVKLGIINPNKGSRIVDVSNYLIKKIKQDYNVDLIYFKEPLWTQKYNELTNNWYWHAIWWGMSDRYIADFRFEGVINENYSYKEPIKYNHFFFKLPSSDERGWNIVENYKDTLWIRNIYTNKVYDLFAKNWVFYNYWYFFMEKQGIDEVALKKEKLKNRITYIAKDNDEQETIDVLKKYIDIWYECYFQKINSFEKIVWELIIAWKINNLKLN